MKKVLAVIITIALLMIPVVSYADGIKLPIDIFGETGGTVTISAPNAVNNGQEFEIYVSYDKKGAEMLYFELSYDSDNLTVCNASSCYSGWGADLTGNSVSVYNESGDPLSAKTQIACITFIVDKDAADETVLTIKAVNCEDETNKLEDATATITVDYISLVCIGDADDNGVVDNDDLQLMTRTLAGWNGYSIVNTDAADVNRDGKVTPKDRAILARYLNGQTAYNLYFA